MHILIKKKIEPAGVKKLLIWVECLLIREINLKERRKTEGNEIIMIVKDY